jgi:phage terminase large subunit
MPHLKRGIIRDFQNLMGKEGLWKRENYNKSEQVYNLNNTTFEFFGADSADKLRGGRRDILFLNEANNISYEAYNQLSIRTREKILIDYNPVCDFWADELLLNDLIEKKKYFDLFADGVAFLRTTYRDNETLEQSIIDEIEKRKITDPSWYSCYGLGLKGTLESAIFHNWKQCDEFPAGGRYECLFLDFGFTNDPTSIGKASIVDGEIYCEELLYNTGMTNYNIASWLKLNKLDKLEIISESAEPKSIEELRRHGIRRIYPVNKSELSVNAGIDLLRQYKINITSKSLNAIKELRFYKWKENKLSATSKYLNVPVDNWNHFIDGLRYWAMTKLTKRTVIPIIATMKSKENVRSIYN